MHALDARRARAGGEARRDRRRAGRRACAEAAERARAARQGGLQPPLPPGIAARRPRRPLRPHGRDHCTCAAATATAGRLGYDREWRADRARSGGGELIDQGMHLLDLSTGCSGRCRCTRRCCARSSGTCRSRTTRSLLLGDADAGALGDAARELDGVEEPVLAGDLLPHGQAAGRRARCAPTARSASHASRCGPSWAAGRRGHRATRRRTARGRREWEAVHSGRHRAGGRSSRLGRPPVGPVRLELH